MLVYPSLASKIVSGSIVTQSNDDAQHNPASVTRMIFPYRNHFRPDNTQPYSYAAKLPDDRFRQI
ncbi:hypothetical protein SJZ71_26920, partial [Klebsiella pneumoniae]|nr:hypothetical protein [Klebsiella pneumoniae]